MLRNNISGKNCSWLTCPRKLFLLGMLSREIFSPDFHPRRSYPRESVKGGVRDALNGV